ncbi:MAG: VWA domain-containing protein [Malacoplasma sp.]|nr:VWA domain-containing protein [Malacoplasma sp.]
MRKEVNITDQLVQLLQSSQTTVLKLYHFVNGESKNPSRQEFDKFRKELIKSVMKKKENALQLFPIVKYFDSKRLTEEDLKNNESLFSVPSGDKVAIASPIEVLDQAVENDEYDLSIMWDLTSLEERESQLFRAVENYYNIVKDDENLKRFIRIIGTFTEENIELLEEEKDLFLENIPQETFALYQSSDLNNLLASEIAQLDDPDLQIIFLKNFVEQKLLTYQLWGIEREIQEEWVIKLKESGDIGPLFICLDTSGSMRNLKEIISKALTLVFVKELEKMNVNLVFVPFSMDAKFYDLYESKVKFKSVKMNLRKSFYGGTDLEKLVNTIDDVIHKQKYERANILLISDMVFKKLPNQVLKKVKEIKERGHKFHSLSINDVNYKNSLLKLFNTAWTYTYNWRTAEESIESELINDLSTSSSLSKETIDTIKTFGIIKKIKDNDFVADGSNKEKLINELNKTLERERREGIKYSSSEYENNADTEF